MTHYIYKIIFLVIREDKYSNTTFSRFRWGGWRGEVLSCFPRERKGLFNLGQSLIMLPIALKHKNMEAAIWGRGVSMLMGFCLNLCEWRACSGKIYPAGWCSIIFGAQMIFPCGQLGKLRVPNRILMYWKYRDWSFSERGRRYWPWSDEWSKALGLREVQLKIWIKETHSWKDLLARWTMRCRRRRRG